MKNRISLFILAILLLGCQSVQGKLNNRELLNWNYGDLRLLDPIDAIEPDQDLIALYSRINDQSFQIRIDFLDLDNKSGKDIYIAIDTNPGGLAQIKVNKNDSVPVEISWDFLIKIPVSGRVIVMDDHLLPVYGMALLIVRDTIQDRIIISFNKNSIPISLGKTKLQIIIISSNQYIVADKSEYFSIDAPSPARARVLFAFWNTFSAMTPAQTLRSWAGAHAGPMSSRHGLKYLLDVAAQTKSTVLLFDLLTPDTVSALDYLNVLPLIRKLANQRILALPDVEIMKLSDVPSDNMCQYLINDSVNYLDISKIWNIGGNIGNSSINRRSDFYLLLSYYENIRFRYGFISVNGYAQYNEYSNNCSLQFYRSNAPDNTLGLSLDCKKLLLSSALMAPTTPLVFGGDFSISMLGDPSVSSEVFTYINEHPWIQKLSIYDLQTTSDLQFTCPTPCSLGQSATGEISQQSNLTHKVELSSVQSNIYAALLQSPNNLIADLSWQVYFSLTQPAAADLLTLRSNYVGQIGQLLAAAVWADKPSPILKCDVDLDYDGNNECILANNNIFTIIEPEGGYIPFVFSLDDRGIHQIIGPTWEFTVGLSDPSTWEISLGVRSDSAQFLGAFSDSFDNWNNYNVNLLNDMIVISSVDMTMRKSISVFPNSIHIEIRNVSQSSNNTFIPLTVDPWLRYTPGWGDLYTSKKSAFIFQWGINSGETVEIRSTTQIKGFPFNATHTALAYPEDPNYDYSPGHYLPFPMALTEISSTENYSVDIIINP